MSGNGKSFCSGGDLVEITTAMTSNLIESFSKVFLHLKFKNLKILLEMNIHLIEIYFIFQI